MPAYLIAEHLISDVTRFEEYRSKVVPMLERYGARYPDSGRIARGPGWRLEADSRCDHRVSDDGCAAKLVSLAGISATH